MKKLALAAAAVAIVAATAAWKPNDELVVKRLVIHDEGGARITLEIVGGEPLVRFQGRDGSDRIAMGLNGRHRPFLTMRDESMMPRLLAGVSVLGPYLNTRDSEGDVLFHTP